MTIADREPCVTLEDVAALAEGRLGGGPRDRVVGHVAGCAECREVLAATLAVLPEITAQAASGSLDVAAAFGRDRRRPHRWAAMLAGLAAGLAMVAAIVSYQRLATPAPPDRGEWLAAMPPAADLLPELWGGVVMRGGEAEDELALQSAELGALLVDLEVAVAAGDRTRAAELLLRMAAVVDQAGLLDEDAARFRRLAEVRGDRFAAAVTSALPAAEARMRERFLPLHLDLGAFAEQARLAAAAGDAAFLDGRRVRRYVDWVLSQDEEPLPPAALEGLETLRRPEATPQARRQAADELLRGLTR